jgi:outer membrane protein OmpU
MKLKQLMLGTSALIGAGALVALPSAPTFAAEIMPGGYPDLTITGFARFFASGGQLDDARQDNSFSRKLDFSNDTEVHVIARAKSEQTGMEYGATIEFEADTNRTDNTDESWLFLRGGWGEVRLGDEDGVADNSSVGAQTLAAGTGGIDGTVIDTVSQGMVYLTNSNDATKIRYYTPTFSGFSFGIDYVPTQEVIDSGAFNGDFLARKDGANAMQAKNVVEPGLVYKGDLGGVAVLASVVGVFGKLTSNGQNDLGTNDDKWWGWQGGANVDLFGFKLGGSFADEEVGNLERTWYTVGIGWGYGPVNTSVNYSQWVDSSGYAADKPYNLVFSADIALAPGLVLAGDVGIFDNDISGDNPNGYTGGDKGWQAIGRLGLAF